MDSAISYVVDPSGVALLRLGGVFGAAGAERIRSTFEGLQRTGVRRIFVDAADVVLLDANSIVALVQCSARFRARAVTLERVSPAVEALLWRWGAEHLVRAAPTGD